MARIQEIVAAILILLCFLMILSCKKDREQFACPDTEMLFHNPTIEKFFGDSIDFYDVEKLNILLLRLNQESCSKDSCSYYIFNQIGYGVRSDSMMSIGYYLRIKKWEERDVVIQCDFVNKFASENHITTGYFRFLKDGMCPILVRNRMDSCSYQKAILYVQDTLISYKRFFNE